MCRVDGPSATILKPNKSHTSVDVEMKFRLKSTRLTDMAVCTFVGCGYVCTRSNSYSLIFFIRLYKWKWSCYMISAAAAVVVGYSETQLKIKIIESFACTFPSVAASVHHNSGKQRHQFWLNLFDCRLLLLFLYCVVDSHGQGYICIFILIFNVSCVCVWRWCLCRWIWMQKAID